jgi:hypothetical protein
MCDWILRESNDLLSDKELSVKVFQAVEYGLLGELVDKSAALPKLEPLDAKKTLKKDKKNTALHKAVVTSLFDELRHSPSHASALIRESAEIVLFYILNQCNNFPSAGGPEVSSMSVTACHVLSYI